MLRFISTKRCRIAAHLVLIAIGFLILFTFRDYGVTWDEELQSQYGLAVVDYYASLFQDNRYEEIFNLYIYGGMFDGLASVFDRTTPFNLYETRHLLNGLVGLLGLWGVWRLGRLLGGAAVGLLALIMVALTPMYYGHMFNNPKDIPFAAGVIWTLYFMGRCFNFQPHVPDRLMMKLGLVMGLMLGVRVGGAMLPAFWVLVLGFEAALYFKNRHKEQNGLTLSYSGMAVLRQIFVVGIIAYSVMLVCWPWAQQSPILNPLRALSEFSNFPQDVEVLLQGTTYRSTELPWFYVPLYFGVQLPGFLLILIAATVVDLPLQWKHLNWPRRKLLTIMLLMVLFPLSYAMLRHPALYDAVRHFLFFVPIACILAAMTAKHICLWALRQFYTVPARRAIATSFFAVGLLAAVPQIYIMYRLHPYEYIFLNRFVGGVAGGYSQYELDYWGSSFKEAAEKLQLYTAERGGVPDGKIYKIAICGPWSAATIYLPPNYEPVIANAPAEFFLSTTRWQCQNMRPGRDIIKIKRMGATLAVIKDLRDGYEHYEGNKNIK